MDLAGTVDAVGSGVAMQPGQRVAGGTKTGAFAEYAIRSASALHPVPGAISAPHAAAYPAAYTTAYVSLVERGQLQAGETPPVPWASGGRRLGSGCARGVAVEAKLVDRRHQVQRPQRRQPACGHHPCGRGRLRPDGAHHRELPGALLTRCRDGGKQHDQAGRQREPEKEFDRAHDLTEAVFVAEDKGAAFLALSELGRGRVATPFDLWDDLLGRSVIALAGFKRLCAATERSMQPLRPPVRVARRLWQW
mgnify:CR=1 FL=1